MARSVVFVGKSDCLELQVDSQADFDAVLGEITRKMEQSGSFFAGARSIHVLGNMTLQQQDALTTLLRDGYGFQQVRFVEKRSPAVPIALNTEDLPAAKERKLRLRTVKRKNTPPARNSTLPEQSAEAVEGGRKRREKEYGGVENFSWGVPKQAPLSLHSEVQNVRENHVIMVYDTVRSGQTVAYDGDIVVLGDVNTGAELIASGSIAVMGVLRGMAHAGSAGDDTASVSANRLIPQQLRIAKHLAIAPPGDAQEESNVPERAFVHDEKIVVQKLGRPTYGKGR